MHAATPDLRLIYASRSAGVLTPLDVKGIVQRSQRNNAKAGVTGALMLSYGIFLQWLEGDPLVVNALCRRVLLDTRHRDPATLAYGEIEQRRYGASAMGPVTTTAANRQIFLKYRAQAESDRYQVRPKALELLFAEMLEHARAVAG